MAWQPPRSRRAAPGGNTRIGDGGTGIPRHSGPGARQRIELRGSADSLFYQRLAVGVGALAERRSGDSGSRRFATLLGGSSKPEERRLKTLRFQGLIAALDRGADADALTGLRRAMAIIGEDRFDARQFLRNLLDWSDRTRIDWTFAYYGHARPDAGAATTPATTVDLEEQAN